MRVKFLILVALFSNGIFAQSIDRVIEILERKNFSTFQQFIKTIKPSTHCSEPGEISKREILANYNEVVANVLLFVPTPKGKFVGECNYYQINLIANNNEIINYEFYSKKIMESEIENYKLIKSYLNEDEIMKFQDLYEKSFHRKLNLTELFDNSITYGRNCGIMGTNPQVRNILKEYINSNNREQLFYWLTSPSYEKKLYGYEGYKALLDKGYMMSERESAIISNLKTFKGLVRTCSGCIFMSEGFSGIINRIKEQRIEYVDTVVSKNENNMPVELGTISVRNPKKGSSGLIVIGLSILVCIGLVYVIIKR